MNETLLEEIKGQVLPLLIGKGVELVELRISRERGRLILRFLVDKSGGITLDECARLNQGIDLVLEQENIMQQSYVLEVSSPGLDRLIKSTRDFQRCLGKLVKIVLHKPINKQNVWIGFMDGVDEEDVTIRTEQEQRLCISRKHIARANLEVQLS